jgi:hypothetical protein
MELLLSKYFSVEKVVILVSGLGLEFLRPTPQKQLKLTPSRFPLPYHPTNQPTNQLRDILHAADSLTSTMLRHGFRHYVLNNSPYGLKK